MIPLRQWAGSALSSGRWTRSATARTLARAWGVVAVRSLVRPGVVPRHVAVVCVGGATLGGSGKTPVAIACVRELAARGLRTVLVGHAFRARPGYPRLVRSGDALAEVGDEALVAARELDASPTASVVVAPGRQAAIDHALAVLAPDVLVLDGPLRIHDASGPRLSILAVDAAAPWGSQMLPPAGDLRAPRPELVRLADHVVPVDATPEAVRWSDSGERVSLAALAGKGGRLGLFTAIGRPERVVRAIAATGLVLEEIASAPDHGPVPRPLRSHLTAARVDGWLATSKCALHLEKLGLPRIGILEAPVQLPAALVDALFKGRPAGRGA